MSKVLARTNHLSGILVVAAENSMNTREINWKLKITCGLQLFLRIHWEGVRRNAHFINSSLTKYFCSEYLFPFFIYLLIFLLLLHRFDVHRILANTVAEERQRQRKNSRKFSRNPSYENGTHACYTGPQGPNHECLNREDTDYLGLEPIRRAELLPELAQDFGLSESDDSGYIPRDRSYR